VVFAFTELHRALSLETQHDSTGERASNHLVDPAFSLAKVVQAQPSSNSGTPLFIYSSTMLAYLGAAIAPAVVLRRRYGLRFVGLTGQRYILQQAER
jgi:hypothetical protein